MFRRMYVHWGWQGGTLTETIKTSICWQVLTQILIVIISWRWDLECFHCFSGFLVLFKYFTKHFVTFAVRKGSRVLVSFFILQDPDSLDFYVLPVNICNWINYPHLAVTLPLRTSTVSCQVCLLAGASPRACSESDSSPSLIPHHHHMDDGQTLLSGLTRNTCKFWSLPLHLLLSPFCQICLLDSNSTTGLSSDIEIPPTSSAPCVSFFNPANTPTWHLTLFCLISDPTAPWKFQVTSTTRAVTMLYFTGFNSSEMPIMCPLPRLVLVDTETLSIGPCSWGKFTVLVATSR